ncbi:MAG TPA: DUF4382 domain-containing protein [Steroidobacteraceae bacterium]|nr:DUF4382 domain-containing protein [Steroidobacteraceae bacterium]
MRAAISAAVATMVLSACGGGGGGGETGRLSLAVTDAPVDEASSVVVQFSGVAFKREGAAPEVVQNLTPSPRQLDLLQYQGGRVALLLDAVTLPAGEYQWIRLIVDNEPGVRDSYISLVGGQECELRVPSGAESGLKLMRGFTLPADGSVALTVDFDLRKSIHAPPGQASGDCAVGYIMRPTLRLVDDANVGAIAGHIAGELITEECLPKVYVFSGAAVTPDDLEEANGADADPLVVAGVTIENGSTSHPYRAAFLPPGPYTVAFTCNDDDAAADDTLVFSGAQSVTVQTNLIATADFAPPTS